MSTVRRSWTESIPAPLVANKTIVFFESLIAITVGWWIVANGLGIVDTISSPELVAASSYALLTSGDWVVHLTDTVRRVIMGFLLTLAMGTVLGVATGMYDFWEKALQDYITIGLALPSLFAAIFAAMWFGISDVTPMVAGAAIAFPFLTQEVYEGVKNIDNDLLQMASAFDVSRSRSIWRVIVQSVMPQWFGGARYSFAICWKITTLAELVAAETGVGFMIEFELNRLSLTGVLTWTLLFTGLMLILEYGLLRQIEKRVFDWRQEATIGWG